MRRTLSILNGSGDTKLTWDQNNPEECEAARQAVADLASRGYQFFLTDGRPTDAVTAGGGALLVRRLEAEEVVAEVEPIEAEPPKPEPEPEPATPPKRRGRPPKNAAVADQNVVAVRPLRGG